MFVAYNPVLRLWYTGMRETTNTAGVKFCSYCRTVKRFLLHACAMVVDSFINQGSNKK